MSGNGFLAYPGGRYYGLGAGGVLGGDAPGLWLLLWLCPCYRLLKGFCKVGVFHAVRSLSWLRVDMWDCVRVNLFSCESVNL